MADKPKVMLIITQDTKSEEARFIRAEIESVGCDVVLMDPSVRKSLGGAEISPEAIAEAGGTTIEDFGRDTGVVLEDGDYETVAGYLIARLGRIAALGDAVDLPEGRLEVTGVLGTRITTVRFEPAVPSA